MVEDEVQSLEPSGLGPRSWSPGGHPPQPGPGARGPGVGDTAPGGGVGGSVPGGRSSSFRPVLKVRSGAQGADSGQVWEELATLGEQAEGRRERGAFVLEAHGFLATPGWGLGRVPRRAFWEGRSELSCV